MILWFRQHSANDGEGCLPNTLARTTSHAHPFACGGCGKAKHIGFASYCDPRTTSCCHGEEQCDRQRLHVHRSERSEDAPTAKPCAPHATLDHNRDRMQSVCAYLHRPSSAWRRRNERQPLPHGHRCRGVVLLTASMHKVPTIRFDCVDDLFGGGIVDATRGEQCTDDFNGIANGHCVLPRNGGGIHRRGFPLAARVSAHPRRAPHTA